MVLPFNCVFYYLGPFRAEGQHITATIDGVDRRFAAKETTKLPFD